MTSEKRHLRNYLTLTKNFALTVRKAGKLDVIASFTIIPNWCTQPQPASAATSWRACMYLHCQLWIHKVSTGNAQTKICQSCNRITTSELITVIKPCWDSTKTPMANMLIISALVIWHMLLVHAGTPVSSHSHVGPLCGGVSNCGWPSIWTCTFVV